MKLFSIGWEWLKPPLNIKNCLLMAMPIIISQILQKLYPIVDSRFISYLGNQALLIHSVQYNFIIFGQFIGMATGISCLVFWKRKECIQKQGSIFIKHVSLAVICMLFFAAIFGYFLPIIIVEYKINSAYFQLSHRYLFIGLCNMILQAVYSSLDGIMIASEQQKKSMLISFLILITNLIANTIGINILFSGKYDPVGITTALIFIGLSTTVLQLFACLASSYFIFKRIKGWEKIHLSEIISVWTSELGIYLIRGITPFIYAFQLGYLRTSVSFLVTYQLVLQLSYILCLPLLASMQLAVRNASEEFSKKSHTKVPTWWNDLLYGGFVPTFLLLILSMIFPVKLCDTIYNYLPPHDHIAFIPIFFFACLAGQVANMLTIPLRSRKKNYLITKNLFVSELIVMLGGTQMLIWFGFATPVYVGFIILLFVLLSDMH